MSFRSTLRPVVHGIRAALNRLHNAWLQALGDAVPYPDLLVPISMVVGDCRRALLPFTPNRFP